MADGVIFPAFLRLEYQDDGSAKTRFLQAVDDITMPAEQRFAEFGNEAKRQIDSVVKSMARGRGFDLGAKEARDSAAAFQLRAQAARALAEATRLAASEQGDFSQSARLSIAALEAEANEQGEAAARALSHADALDQVTAQMSRATGAAAGVRAANDNLGRSTAAMRFGFQQVGFQISDFAVQVGGGTSAVRALSQQLPQLTQAVAFMGLGAEKSGGKFAAFAGFMGGPWGVAITVATAALTPLIGKLFETRDAAQETATALQQAMHALFASIEHTTPLQKVLNEATKQRVDALADIARLNREIASVNANIAGVQKMPDAGPGAVGSLYSRRGDLEKQLAAARDRAQDAEDSARNAIAAVRIHEWQQERIRQVQGQGSTPSASGGPSGSSGAHAAGLSAEARATVAAADATDRYIASLGEEIARMGKSPAQLRQAEIAKARDAAATDAQREALDRLNQQREEAYSAQARQDAIDKDEAATEALNARLRAMETETKLLGLVGPARDRAALALEQDTFKAQAAADGILDVDAAWQRYFDTRSRQIDTQTALDRDAEAARSLAGEMDRLIGSVARLGSVGGALGGLLGLASGNIGAIGGPAGALLQTVIGTRTDEQGRVIAKTIGDELHDVFGLNGDFGKAVQAALKGAGIGALASSALFGRQSAGGQLGSALGGAAGEAAGKALTKGLSGFLGEAGGPLGAIAGGLLGGLAGGLFGGTKSGRVTLNGTGLALGGTNKQLQGAAGQVGGDLLSTLQSVAEQLGGTLGSYGTITLGQRNGSYRVNVGGSGKGSLKLGHGARDFGTDQEAAIAYALQQAIVHGAVKGISAGAQRLLAAGKDLQAQMKKALDFQGVFDELKQATDPVGYALDQLNKRFGYLKDVFAEAGASAEDYAKLEQLYGIDRAKALSDAMNQVGGSLKSLLGDLTTGDMGLSLRDREKAAQSTYDSLAARVRSGDTTAYDDFAEAARTLLDIERQVYGSQSAYFSTFDNVRELTKTTLDKQQALIDGAANRDSPFSGSSSSAAPDNQGVIDGLDRLGDRLIEGIGASLGYKLDALNANLGSAMAKIGGASGGPAKISVYDLLSASAGSGW